MKIQIINLTWTTAIIAVVSLSATANGQTIVPSPVSSASPAKTEAITAKEDQARQKTAAAGQTANETRNAMPGSSPKAVKIVRIRQGDELSVEVSDLKERVEKQPVVLKTIRLFLDCKRVENVTPVPCLGEKKVVFTLDRKAMEQITTSTKIVSVGISFTDPENAELVMPEKVQLVSVARDYRLWLVVIIIGLMAFVLWVYGRHTNLLRDGQPPGPAAANAVPWQIPGGGQTPGYLKYLPGFDKVKTNKGALAQYSLAKVQMAWWLFFIVAAFLFIWLAVGDYNTVTTSTLVLFGISVGTAVSSKMVDASKQSNAQDLKATKAALDQQITQLSAAPSSQAGVAPAAAPVSVADAQTQLAMKAVQREQVKAQLDNLTVKPEEAISQGFLTDIMSDENGVSIHRFQMVVWTVVLTLIFAYEVYKTLSMPEFSNTLLTLMGISSGTYVTLKVPEKHSVVSS